MANPLKILTVLTASEAAQFKKAVQVETGGLTVSAGGLTVSAGDVSVSAGNLSVVGTMSGSGNAQIGGNLTVAGDITLRDANLRDARLSGNAYLANAYLTGAVLSGDAYLANAYLTGATVSGTASVGAAVVGAVYGATSYFSGSTLHLDGVTFNSITSSLKGLITAEASARIAGDIAVAATASANLNTVSGALKIYIDAQDIADAAAWAASDVQVAATASANLNTVSGAFDTRVTALSGAVSSSIAAEALARANEDLKFLYLDGTRAMTAALNMGSQDITSAKSGSFSGDVTVGGNLQVNGALTYVNTTNLDVTDKLVTLAKGAANAAAANGGGIELEGAGASLTYASSGDKWVSNKSFEVASDLFISGAGDFSYINVARSSGKYDVDAAIQALDVAVSGAVNAGGNFKADYNARRHVATGNLSSGQAILNLTTLGGAEFAAGEISKIALDVMIDSDSTGYTNDLVAIKMFVDGADVKVQIDAPATPSAAYRLIAVNEEDIA